MALHFKRFLPGRASTTNYQMLNFLKTLRMVLNQKFWKDRYLDMTSSWISAQSCKITQTVAKRLSQYPPQTSSLKTMSIRVTSVTSDRKPNSKLPLSSRTGGIAMYSSYEKSRGGQGHIQDTVKLARKFVPISQTSLTFPGLRSLEMEREQQK